MSITSTKKGINLRQIIPLVLIGLGLIAIGFVAFSLLTRDNTTQGISVVPSKVNFSAPDLALNNLDGKKVNISDYRDQIVLINNWATWCPPCKLEMPTLQKYYAAHSQQGFILIGIEAGDTEEDVRSFVTEYKLTFPVLMDPDEKSLSAFHNDSLPSSYVIDHNGNVVLAWTGPINLAMLEKYVTPLLEQ